MQFDLVTMRLNLLSANKFFLRASELCHNATEFGKGKRQPTNNK